MNLNEFQKNATILKIISSTSLKNHQNKPESIKPEPNKPESKKPAEKLKKKAFNNYSSTK